MSLITIHHLYLHIENQEQIDLLLQRSETIMTSVTELNTKLDALNEAVTAERQEVLDALTAFKAAVQALKDQIAAGTPASQAQLDALGARLDEQITKVQGIITASDTQG